MGVFSEYCENVSIKSEIVKQTHYSKQIFSQSRNMKMV